MKMVKLLAYAIVFSGVVGCASTGSSRPQESYDAAHFERTATVTDDDLESVATISTQYGWQTPPNFLFGVVHDTYFRAFVDKKTGHTEIQVFTWVRYPGDTWRGYAQANYQTPTGVQTVDVVKPGQPGVDCSMRSLGCIYLENVGFNVPEDTLRAIASDAQKPDSSFWKFRLKARAGADYDGLITAAEIRGLLAKLDAYRAGKGKP